MYFSMSSLFAKSTRLWVSSITVYTFQSVFGYKNKAVARGTDPYP